MGFKENLKFRREQLGYSHEELAKKIGVTKPTISRYETGVISNVPPDKVEALAVALDTNPSWLMGWSNNIHPTCFNMLYKYDKLDERGKETFKAILDYEYNRCLQSGGDMSLYNK